MKCSNALVLFVVMFCAAFAGNASPDANACLRMRVASSGLKIGYDKANARFVEIGIAESQVCDPSDGMIVDKLRNDLTNIAILNAKRDLMYKISRDVSGSDRVAVLAGDKWSEQDLKSVMRIFAAARMSGCRIIASAESWDAASHNYQVAVAIGWSEKASRQASEALQNWQVDEAKNDPDDQGWKEWATSNDLSTMLGCRCFRDGDGTLRFVGIGFAVADDMTGAKLKLAMRKSSLRAVANLSYLLYSDAMASEVAVRYLRELESGEPNTLSWASFASEIAMRCRGRKCRGHEVYATTITHPLSGRKMYVSVYGIALKREASE